MKRLHLRIQGRVQGVFYRTHTEKKAQSLHLTGWVRNSDDGSVEIVTEGEETALQELKTWCQTGSPNAEVTSVDETWEEATGEFSQFEIRQ